MNESKIIEYLFSEAGFTCFAAGFIICMFCDCLFAVIINLQLVASYPY